MKSKATLIETPCGPMTRHEAALLSGLAHGTICQRVWLKWPVEWLFVRFPKGNWKSTLPDCLARWRKLRPPKPKVRRRNVGSLHTEKRLTMPYAEYRAMKRAERARCANTP